MTNLSIVLLTKISMTLVLWAIPPLLLPLKYISALGFPLSQPLIFFRLLGMAYLALVLAYFFGLKQLQDNIYPFSTVWVGILSNGGAFAILGGYAIRRSWSKWGMFSQIYMWISTVATGLIALALIVNIIYH